MSQPDIGYWDGPVVLISDIQRATSKHFGLKPIEMVSARRSRDVARPRQVAMYLARELTPHSLPMIGRLFGNRDHTTVMHAIREIERRIETEPEIAYAVAAITAAVGCMSLPPEVSDDERASDAVRGSAALRDAIMAVAA